MLGQPQAINANGYLSKWIIYRLSATGKLHFPHTNNVVFLMSFVNGYSTQQALDSLVSYWQFVFKNLIQEQDYLSYFVKITTFQIIFVPNPAFTFLSGQGGVPSKFWYKSLSPALFQHQS